MSIFNIFSRRQKEARGDFPDVYQYTDLPNQLRVQIIQIFAETIGTNEQYNNRYSSDVAESYKAIVFALRKEYGLFLLPPTTPNNDEGCLIELFNFFLKADDIEKCMDVIELGCRVIDQSTRYFNYLSRQNCDELADIALSEVNQRLKEHGVGFQYEDGKIIRVDSQLLHKEAVIPALTLLNTKKYKGAHEEFISAYDHYRHGKNKEALNDCLKSFESTMKAICDKRKWTYKPTDTASKLIQVCWDNGLVPPFWQTQLSALKTLLESSVPTGRNKLSGHGQGAAPAVVPDYIAAYMLHMTASTLVFLTTAEAELP